MEEIDQRNEDVSDRRSSSTATSVEATIAFHA